MSTMRRPLVVTAQWERAVAAAGGHCACPGRCGARHSGARNSEPCQGSGRLYVTADGRALCVACFDAVTRTARKLGAASVPAEAGALFDL
ncbi:hypothetical protein [Streptomyces zhihengii]|uniref:ClpX-type ZB domain-containing protein n=1 Tax=Streptomyces zhihengii TaxID=1818004 RepID=A0ABS2UXM2_9ACTN|nr:hypothetical protein [Streptomyces zhihengii]MBM9622239.1 hypothetical protein [Streptomyces zhihengii]